MDGIYLFDTFVEHHRPQLVLSNIPKHFWPMLFKKLKDQIFDAGSVFSLFRIDYENSEKNSHDPLWGVQAKNNIKKCDPQHIYLVDHAWTFRIESMRSQLRNIPGLLDRMINLLQVPVESDDTIEEVLKGIWKFSQTYSIGGQEISVENRVPLWYIMDELGSGINHSDSPNFRTVPFIHIPEQMTYTLLFPIEDVDEGDLITRDFIEGTIHDPLQKRALLVPWTQNVFAFEDYEQTEPDKDYFLSGHLVETLPVNLKPLESPPNKILKVYSEYEFINEYLTSPLFEIVDNEDDADILWYINHYKKFKELSETSPEKYVNQFPFEYVITIKDLLAIVARRAAKNKASECSLTTLPKWLPTTFNMKTELSKLIAFYMKRESLGLDNHWICKPFNLARSLDTYITNNLDLLCRLPLTGPKVAQKYIENPVVFKRDDLGSVKFDIRYVILLRSVNPTKVYIYKNFFLRFANKPFSMSHFDDYEKHFTVMNYQENAQLFRMLCKDFKQSWEHQHPQHRWEDVENQIFEMLRELFICATEREPPCGLASNPQSRSLYAVDLMLAWEENVVQPKLLELNWMPDCKRACEYYPDFYNDIFSTLFLDKCPESCIQIL